ncbi:hypothetical protein LCGC14_0835920 [marine sediment metagenome]|uniref:Sulfotransferase domain-containing protein n=1 Tax=marine sediment metagenome TaxID=412755 RepID=A0A0F9PZV3_9ZZZZ
MKEVIVNAFPKSGMTWLLRLLCDLLEAQHKDTPQMETLSYGHPIGNEWIVKKRHGPYWKETVPTYWDLSDTSTLAGGTVVMIQRDPRDVVVSGMFYYQNPDAKFAIGVMVSSQYVDYLNSWLKPIESLNVAKLIFTQYELLHSHPIKTLRGIIKELTGEWLSDARIEEALERQSFENMSRQYTDGGHFMRKGIVGDWRNHFTRDLARKFNEHFGEFMLAQGYVDNLDWWKDV